MSTIYVNPYRFTGGAFTPLDLPNLLLWLDASDASTITESSGLVSQWDDKSGNGNHVTASGSSRPTTGTRTIGGVNGLDFSGSNKMERSDALGLTGNPDFFFAAVLKCDVNDDNDRFIHVGESSGTNAGKNIAVATDGSYRYNNGSQVFTSLGTGDLIVSGQRESGDQYDEGEMWFDNVAQSSGSTNTTTPNLVDNATYIGSGLNSGGGAVEYFNGIMGSLIVCEADLTAQQRSDLQDYLSAAFPF